jgi:hypothetical protein
MTMIFGEIGAQSIQPPNELACFTLGVRKPIGGPNSVEPPPEAFEDLLTKAVTITHRYARMIRLPIALDACEEPVGVVGVAHTDIDTVTLDANLGDRLVACFPKVLDHMQLEVAVRRMPGSAATLQPS